MITNIEFPRPKSLRNWISYLFREVQEKRYTYNQNQVINRALKQKRIVFGPFIGELGHLLAHNLPLISYLHKQGVHVEFIGFERFKPFLKDDKGNNLFGTFHLLRDFSVETKIVSNSAEKTPEDVQRIIESIKKETRENNTPELFIDKPQEYWLYYRKWVHYTKYRYSYSLDKVYATSLVEPNSCAIFIRSKNVVSKEQQSIKAEANGPLWDYQELIRQVARRFNKVYLIGTPNESISNSFKGFDNVICKVGLNNTEMLEVVCNSRLVITPHSGAMYLSAYFNTQFLIIYRGIKHFSEIGDITSTLTFLNRINSKTNLIFAFQNEDLVLKIEEINNEKTRN